MFQPITLPTDPALLAEPNSPFIHRDLSWIQFNERVLAEASQPSNPLLERTKFLSISSSNIDEFFMIRFSSLARSISASLKNPDQVKTERLRQIRSNLLDAVAKFKMHQAETLAYLSVELQSENIYLVKNPQENSIPFVCGKQVFDEKILPHLSPPTTFSPSQISTLENLQITAFLGQNQWIRILKTIPLAFWMQEQTTSRLFIFFLDDLLLTHLGHTFRTAQQPGLIRLTRDGDFTLDLDEEDTESIPDRIRSSLGTRDKGHPVCLQTIGTIQEEFVTQIATVLKLGKDQTFATPFTLCLPGLWSTIRQLPDDLTKKPSLSYKPFKSNIPKAFQSPQNIFDQLKKRDYLLHHPYDSFDAFVSWIQAACQDPDVVSIEQTVYRMDALSQVVEALKSAASTKKVRVIIELRARFDELNNLSLAETLRNAGVEVAFGFGKLKLHAKIVLITRNEGGTQKLYTHLSTGNYNATTTRQYTDLSILTSNPEMGEDARRFFDAVWNEEIPTSFKKLVAAPGRLHRKIISHIEHEIKAAQSGAKARIVAKVNALVDTSVIENLYRASCAGVQVDLIVRGACSLIPGIPGLSENIRVISVVDRFLEHSRIYYFENAKVIYLSSADWMQRNFFSRLELAFPVLDPQIYTYLEQVVIPTYVSDTTRAKELTASGHWKACSTSEGTPACRSQFKFEELAEIAYAGTPLA